MAIRRALNALQRTSASLPLRLRGVREARVGDGRGALRVRLGVEDDVHAARPFTPVEARRARRGRGALAQRDARQPGLAQRLAHEGVEEPRDRHDDGPRDRDAKPVGVLADRTRPARALIAADDRLRIPGQRVDAEPLGDPARDLAPGAVGGAPLVEEVEPRLPPAARPRVDLLVGRREHRGSALHGRRLGLRRRREDDRPCRRVALAGLPGARPHAALEGLLTGHVAAPCRRRRSRDSRSRHPTGKGGHDDRASRELEPPLPPLRPAA